MLVYVWSVSIDEVVDFWRVRGEARVYGFEVVNVGIRGQIKYRTVAINVRSERMIMSLRWFRGLRIGLV